MQASAAVTLLAISTGALGLIVGATLLGRNAPHRADASLREPVDFTALVASMNALRDSIEADSASRGSDLAQPAPRVPIHDAASAPAGSDPALTQAVEDLRAAILGLRLQSAGERPPLAGVLQADRLTDARRPMDVAAIEAFLERYPELREGEVPLELTFYGLADYVELFGTPSQHIARGDGSHYLSYWIDPGEPKDGRRIEARCTRDATTYSEYVE